MLLPFTVSSQCQPASTCHLDGNRGLHPARSAQRRRVTTACIACSASASHGALSCKRVQQLQLAKAPINPWVAGRAGLALDARCHATGTLTAASREQLSSTAAGGSEVSKGHAQLGRQRPVQQSQQQQWRQQQYKQRHEPANGASQAKTQQYQQQWQQHPKRQQQQQPPPLLLFQGGSNNIFTKQQAASGAPDPTVVATLLTHKISSSESLQQLEHVVSIHRAALSPVHISAAVSRAAKLCPGQLSQAKSYEQQQQRRSQSQQQQQLGQAGAYMQPQPQQQQLQQPRLHQHKQQLKLLVDALLQQFLSQLSAATVLEVSCIIGGLARLGYNSHDDVICNCLDATGHLLGSPEVDNKQVMQLAWGLGRLGHKPNDDWLACFEAESLKRIPTLNNIETSNAVWVFAKWGVKPSDAWLSAFLSHLPSQLLTMQPPEICSVLWAAAMMPLHLPSQVLDGLLLESQVKFGAFTGQAFGTLAWSLARMDIKPRRMWLQDFIRHSGTALSGVQDSGRDQAFTNIIWALGCWEHIPPKQWLQEYCRCVVPQLASMTPQGLAITAVGLAELHHHSPTPFTCYLLELFHQRLGAATAAQAAALVWALPRLLLQQTNSQAPFSAAAGQSGGDAASAGAGAGWLRQYCWHLQDFADHMLSGLERLHPTELVDVAVGYADLAYFPGVAWMDEHERNINRHLDQLTTAQIGIVKQAYLRLEKAEQQQHWLLHPEQLQALQQQQRRARVGAGVVVEARERGWHVRSSSHLAVSAAAAAAATAADRLGLDSKTVGPAAAAAAGTFGTQQQDPQGPAGRRFEPASWSNSSTSSRGRKKGKLRRHNRGPHDAKDMLDEPDAVDRVGISAGSRSSKTFGGLEVLDQPELLPTVPNKPRAARLRIQKIRQAEREQQQQQSSKQRRQELRLQQQWRVTRPGEFKDE